MKRSTSYILNDNSKRTKGARCSILLEIPELVQIIIAHIPFEYRKRARLVNRTWNSNTVYTPDEKQILLERASRNGHLVFVEQLLQDPRVNHSANDNIAIYLASEKGKKEIVHLLIQETTVDRK